MDKTQKVCYTIYVRLEERKYKTMGEYERTYKQIDELKKRKIELIKYINGLYEELYAIDIKIGECEGYIKELEYIDGEDY